MLPTVNYIGFFTSLFSGKQKTNWRTFKRVSPFHWSRVGFYRPKPMLPPSTMSLAAQQTRSATPVAVTAAETAVAMAAVKPVVVVALALELKTERNQNSVVYISESGSG